MLANLPPLSIYLFALALTLGVEVPIALAMAGKGKRLRMAWDAPLLNLFTHPQANLIYFMFAKPWAIDAGFDPLVAFALVEAGVIAVEALGFALITKLDWRRALGISVVANGATIALSFVPWFG